MRKITRITKDMKIEQVIKNFPETAPIFFKYGLHCFSCPMSAPETVGEAAKLHQIEIEKFLGDLNETISPAKDLKEGKGK